ncbi:hypothetical protein M0802_016486 [Mischocyttarus mexicanus]|nr:hypothetical protein M0802_016487 [Mischocyttarus mexicanus]KAI4472825.1 hypothetical protein M0802_016486 [Mischocyttarus mexicanus]
MTVCNPFPANRGDATAPPRALLLANDPYDSQPSKVFPIAPSPASASASAPLPSPPSPLPTTPEASFYLQKLDILLEK